jgi:hypothetical protein
MFSSFSSPASLALPARDCLLDHPKNGNIWIFMDTRKKEVVFNLPILARSIKHKTIQKVNFLSLKVSLLEKGKGLWNLTVDDSNKRHDAEVQLPSKSGLRCLVDLKEGLSCTACN